MEESIEQLDPTSEITPEAINKKVVSGAAILTARMILLQVISFIANALLTVFLNPSQYGTFFLVSAVINFLTYFGDIGLAAALIQKKEALTKEDLRTIFTVQQILVFTLLVIVLGMTPVIQNVYKFNLEAIYLLWALAISLVLSSIKTIPTVLLERNLEFKKLVIPQIVESLVFSITTVFLAWKGFGITSFTIAVLLRGILGLITTYIVMPWMPGFSFSTKSLKQLLKFGFPYQMNVFLAMIKDDGITLFLGVILGSSGVGLLGWAQKWAYAPLRFFMDQVIKVTFPAFSRLQDHKEELSRAVSKSIFFICLLVFPALFMLVLTAPSLVVIIPKYIKWSPAVFALSVLAITSGLAAITTPITNALNAIGKISITFKLMIMWTVLTWVFVPISTHFYGLNGAAAALTLVGLTSVIAMFVASKYIKINYLQSVGKPLLASSLMAVFVYIVRIYINVSWPQIITMITVGGISYITFVLLLEPSLIRMVREQIKQSKS